LRSVVQGYFNYHAVPGNIDSLQSFRAQVVWHWSRALQRRSQKSRMPWERFGPLVARWIPSATILHPRPAMRFNARYLRKSRMQQSCRTDLCGGREVNSRPYRDCGRGERATAPLCPLLAICRLVSAYVGGDRSNELILIILRLKVLR